MLEVQSETKSAPVANLEDARALVRNLGQNCRAAVQGRDDVIALVLTAMLADGHVLLEDHPGSGKTTLAKAIGGAIRRPEADTSAFRRIQFTPDLLPSDLTGATVFDPESRSLSFRPGPVFANIVLADEINRTGPKVQAALLEAMAEKQVTVDNHTHRLDPLFFVIATQNPLDKAGTYPLPRAQLDRFLFKVRMNHLSRDAELEVLTRWKVARTRLGNFQTNPDAIIHARQIVTEGVQVSQQILECLADISHATRHDKRILLGLSTRALVMALPALQVWAALGGRDYVAPSDVKRLAIPLFSHRVEPAPNAPDMDLVITELTSTVVEKYTRKTLSG